MRIPESMLKGIKSLKERLQKEITSFVALDEAGMNTVFCYSATFTFLLMLLLLEIYKNGYF